MAEIESSTGTEQMAVIVLRCHECGQQVVSEGYAQLARLRAGGARGGLMFICETCDRARALRQEATRRRFAAWRDRDVVTVGGNDAA